MQHIPLAGERHYLPQNNHLLAEKTLSHQTPASNLLGPGKTIEYPSFPIRSGIKAILPQASGSSCVCATTRRGLDTDRASSAIQQLKECQRTFPLDSTQSWLAVRPRVQKKIPSFQDHPHCNRSDK